MSQLLEILEKLNPWWKGKAFETGLPRNDYLSKIKSYLTTKEIVVVTGIRRSGKTVLLLQTIHDLLREQKVEPKRILFVNFDEADLASLQNPIKDVLDTYFQDVYAGENSYLFFDEIQNAEGWERWAKSMYDRKSHQLIISGSSSHLLGSELATLISGRYLKLTVFPLAFREYLLFNNFEVKNDRLSLASGKHRIMNHLRDYLRDGGFPQVALQKDNNLKAEHLKNYYESIIYKDIIALHEIRNVAALKALLHYLVSNFTSLFSYKKLGELLKIDFSTLKEYFQHIEEARLLSEISFFSYSLKKQNRNNKKIYCIDNGLRNAVSFTFSKDEGKLAENLVFIELRRRENEVYYWRSQKHEVDFVVKDRDQSLTAINVTYGDEADEREIKGLLAFRKEFKKTDEMLIITKDIERAEEGIRFIPLWKWLLFDSKISKV